MSDVISRDAFKRRHRKWLDLLHLHVVGSSHSENDFFKIWLPWCLNSSFLSILTWKCSHYIVCPFLLHVLLLDILALGCNSKRVSCGSTFLHLEMMWNMTPLDFLIKQKGAGAGNRTLSLLEMLEVLSHRTERSWSGEQSTQYAGKAWHITNLFLPANFIPYLQYTMHYIKLKSLHHRKKFPFPRNSFLGAVTIIINPLETGATAVTYKESTKLLLQYCFRVWEQKSAKVADPHEEAHLSVPVAPNRSDV